MRHPTVLFSEIVVFKLLSNFVYWFNKYSCKIAWVYCSL